MKKIVQKVAFLIPIIAIIALLIVAPVHADDGSASAQAVTDLSTDLNTLWTLLAGFLVFFMQAGFALVETGFTRNKNVAHTMLMNMMVFCIGAIGYWLTGFALQFGGVNYTYPAIGSLSAWSFSPTTLSAWATDKLASQ